jgi:hypothetical protein
MLAFLRRLFGRSAFSSPGFGPDGEAAAQNLELRTALAEERSTVRILELEQKKLLDVIERDRLRVQAEMRVFAASVADAERKAVDRDAP